LRPERWGSALGQEEKYWGGKACDNTQRNTTTTTTTTTTSSSTTGDDDYDDHKNRIKQDIQRSCSNSSSEPPMCLSQAVVFCKRQSGIPATKSTGVLQRTRATACEAMDWQITDLFTTLLGELQLDTMYVAV